MRRLLILWVVASRVAAADPPTLAALAKAYAEKNGLPVRVVQRDLGTREIERHFVPVLEKTHDDFLATFNVKKGAVVWRASIGDPIHPAVSIRPGETLHFQAPPNMSAPGHDLGGHYLTLAIDPKQYAHWRDFIKKWAPDSGNLFEGRERYRMPGTNVVHGGCMWWLVHAELADGLNLATAMGVRRAKGPEVLAPRLIHAGNELVGPIGIPVPSIAAFKKLTDDELLGPEPAGGAAEQVKL